MLLSLLPISWIFVWALEVRLFEIIVTLLAKVRAIALLNSLIIQFLIVILFRELTAKAVPVLAPSTVKPAQSKTKLLAPKVNALDGQEMFAAIVVAAMILSPQANEKEIDIIITKYSSIFTKFGDCNMLYSLQAHIKRFRSLIFRVASLEV